MAGYVVNQELEIPLPHLAALGASISPYQIFLLMPPSLPVYVPAYPLKKKCLDIVTSSIIIEEHARTSEV